MEFLLEAMKRSKRVLELRDVLLLLLRTACLILFGLALARPQLSSTATDVSSGQPVHAVFIVDNSLSMGYRAFNTTLLDDAKGRVGELIERLPQGSRFTVLPLCGSANAYSHDAYRTVQDARDALQRIEVVDRTGTAALAVDLAVAACATVPELPAKRVLLVGDQQRNNWPKDVLSGRGDALPELQIVAVTADRPENAWVSEFKLQDGVADIETPAILVGTIRYDGAEPRKNVQVTLAIDGMPVSTRSVDLEPGQSREVQFTHEFDLPIAPGQTGFVPATLTLSPDHLAQDDQRFLSIPVVAALPVVFVDQFGPQESAQQNKLGETLPLRRLLAPVLSRGDTNRQLVQIQHLALDDLTQDVLQDARMVVLAGLEKPGAVLPLLKEYALQGGQVVLAAGAGFDPKAWSDEAWLDGAGLLPFPLKPQPIGKTPEETSGTLEPFFLNPATMTSADFYLEETSKEELEDLYRLPLFFKTVVPETSDAAVQQVVRAATTRIMEERARKAEGAKAKDGSAESESDSNRWLRWEVTEDGADSQIAPEQLANRERPLVLAAFGNQVPYLVERRLGRGSVLFVSSGFQSNWNNLIKTNAVLVFDQLLRTRLSRTLVERTLLTQGERLLPVPAADRRATFELERPNGTRETLTVDALGPDQYGLTLRDLLQRGIYQITASVPAKTKSVAGPQLDTEVSAGEKLWELPVAVNGLASESELATLDASELSERAGDLKYRWLSPGQSLSLEGTEVGGMNFWTWLMVAVLLCLLAEMAVLAWPTHSREVPA